MVALIRDFPVRCLATRPNPQLLLGFVRKFDSTDLRHALPKCKAVERLDSQTHENLYAIFQLAVDAEKEATLRVFLPFIGCGISDSPMRADRLARPNRTLLCDCLVAD